MESLRKWPDFISTIKRRCSIWPIVYCQYTQFGDYVFEIGDNILALILSIKLVRNWSQQMVTIIPLSVKSIDLNFISSSTCGTSEMFPPFLSFMDCMYLMERRISLSTYTNVVSHFCNAFEVIASSSSTSYMNAKSWGTFITIVGYFSNNLCPTPDVLPSITLCSITRKPNKVSLKVTVIESIGRHTVKQGFFIVSAAALCNSSKSWKRKCGSSELLFWHFKYTITVVLVLSVVDPSMKME